MCPVGGAIASSVNKDITCTVKCALKQVFVHLPLLADNISKKKNIDYKVSEIRASCTYAIIIEVLF